MSLAEKLICQEITNILVEATQKAAIYSSKLIGCGKKNEADFLAVKGMQEVLKQSSYKLEVVIGEGEMDEAPMLFIGEKFGKIEPKFEIAADPLEGTNLCANNMPNSITTLAVAEENSFLKAPDCYMQKIASGKVHKKGVLDINFSVKKNITNLAEYLNKNVSEIQVIMLDRKRHEKTIAEIRSLGAKVNLISDGDINAIIQTTNFGNGADLYLGEGGAPEGVLAASIIKACNGFMMGKLKFENEEQKKRAISYGLTNPDEVLTLNKLVKGNTIFVASGVTNGDLLKGVQLCKKTNLMKVESIIFASIKNKTNIIKITNYRNLIS